MSKSDQEITIIENLIYRPHGKMGRLAVLKVLWSCDHYCHERDVEEYCRKNHIEGFAGYTEDDTHFDDEERRSLISKIKYKYKKENKKRKKAHKTMPVKKIEHIVDLKEQEIIDESEPPESVVNGGYVPLTREQIDLKYGQTLEDYEKARTEIAYRPAFYYSRQFNYKKEKEEEIIDLKKQNRRLETSRDRYKEKYYAERKKCDD